jgi:hypothetical protein
VTEGVEAGTLNPKSVKDWMQLPFGDEITVPGRAIARVKQ